MTMTTKTLMDKLAIHFCFTLFCYVFVYFGAVIVFGILDGFLPTRLLTELTPEHLLGSDFDVRYTLRPFVHWVLVSLTALVTWKLMHIELPTEE
jgi:hypothetical protein